MNDPVRWTVDTTEVTDADDEVEYRVTWVVEVSAASPQAAALKARHMQLNPESTATVFEVEVRNF